MILLFMHSNENPITPKLTVLLHARLVGEMERKQPRIVVGRPLPEPVLNTAYTTNLRPKRALIDSGLAANL